MDSRLKLTFERKIVGGFAIGLAILLLVGVISWASAHRFLESFQWVDHTREVLRESDGMLLSVLRVESGARGFAVTGDDRFLETHESDKRAARGAIARLQALTLDNPEQHRRLEQIAPLVERRLGIADHVISLRRASGFQAASNQVSTGAGEQTMDQIRALAGQFKSAESSLLEGRTAEVAEATKGTVGIVFFSILAAFVSAAVAMWRIHREFRRRAAAEAALKQSSEEIRDLYNNAPCVYHSLDAGGCFQAMNDTVGSSRVDLQACKLEYSIVSPK